MPARLHRMSTPEGDRLRDARERRKMTQQEVASAIGVTMRTVGNWERGASVPRNRAAALHELLGIDEPAVAGSRDAARVMFDLPTHAIAGMSEAEQEEVRAAAQLAALAKAREIRGNQ